MANSDAPPEQVGRDGAYSSLRAADGARPCPKRWPLGYIMDFGAAHVPVECRPERFSVRVFHDTFRLHAPAASDSGAL
jgi:hypothetical protein